MDDLDGSFALPAIGPFVLYLVSAFILLRWSRSIASRLVREDQPVELELDEKRQKPLYTLSLRIVGAVVLIKAVPAVVGAVVQITFRSRFSMTTTAAWISLISNIVYLALGVYFIGGAKEVVRIALRGSLRESDSDDR